MDTSSMLDNSFQSRLMLLLASSLFGLIPMVVSLVVKWLEGRSQTTRVNNVLNQTTHRVDFLTKWFNLQKEVCAPEQLANVKKAVSDELTDSFELFMDVVLDPDKATKHRREVIAQYRKTGKLKRFFLMYTPYNGRGWLFHTLYYMSVLPLFGMLIYVIFSFIQTQDFLASIPREYMYATAGILILSLFFRHLGRRAAKEVEERMIKIDQKTLPLRGRPDLAEA